MKTKEDRAFPLVGSIVTRHRVISRPGHLPNPAVFPYLVLFLGLKLSGVVVDDAL
jgi:hypothetical protein